MFFTQWQWLSRKTEHGKLKVESHIQLSKAGGFTEEKDPHEKVKIARYTSENGMTINIAPIGT